MAGNTIKRAASEYSRTFFFFFYWNATREICFCLLGHMVIWKASPPATLLSVNMWRC